MVPKDFKDLPVFKRKRQLTNNLMIDSEITDVIANILKMNEPLVVPVPVRGLIVFDTNGIEEVDSGFRITHTYANAHTYTQPPSIPPLNYPDA